jgi:hypothetical protein
MLTDHNLATALQLLASFNEAMQYKLAHNPKPMKDWMRKAKPIAGLDLIRRPLPDVVFYIIKERVEQRQLRDQEARASELPALPSEIVIKVPPYRAKLAEATTLANRKAARSPMNETVAKLRKHEAKIRATAERHAAFTLDAYALDLLDLAAHLHQAAEILDDPAGYDSRPFQI